jgi:hypothetical protein
MNTSALMTLGITGALLWAAWKYGNAEVKGMALGAAGVVLLNQIPVARDGLNTRLLAA